jgi:hypothetical protein
MNRRVLPLLAVILLMISWAHARTWYVKPDGSGDAPTVADAVDSSATGDTVLVADGTHSFVCASFSGKETTILSESQNPEAARLATGSTTFYMTDYSTLRLSGFLINSGGAGVFSWRSDAYVTNCVFEGVAGDAMVRCDTSSVAHFTSCSFIDAYGGVCVVEEGSGVAFTSCALLRNGGHPAGAVFLIGRDCDVVMTGCTLAFNDHLFKGTAASPTTCYGLYLTNCLVAFNEDEVVSGSDYCEVVLTCCDIYGNSGGDFVGWLAGQEGVTGNFSAGPLFCDIHSGEITVEACSPCLPGNHPAGYDCGGVIGAGGSGCGCGAAVSPTTWGGVKALYR